MRVVVNHKFQSDFLEWFTLLLRGSSENAKNLALKFAEITTYAL